MKLIISVLMAVTLSACANNDSLFSPSASTSSTVPIGDVGYLSYSTSVSKFGTYSSASTYLYGLLGTGSSTSFSVSW